MSIEQEIANAIAFLNSLSKDYKDFDFIFSFNYKDKDSENRGGTLMTEMEIEIFENVRDEQLDVYADIKHGIDLNETVERVKKILNEKNSDKDGGKKTD
tara:strand:- start:91 stop:387 length:297 start_codon:yes stop_codon:yes gene_type:complete